MLAIFQKFARGRINAQKIKSIRRRFQAINNARLKRVRDALKVRQQIFVDVLPLLFHLNHPALPGYLSKSVPTGISDFSPSKDCIEASKKISQAIKHHRVPSRSYMIYGLYMMGSSGSVAQSEKSDFDIWVCHRPDLSSDNVQILKEKCTLVQQWAATLGLEVNFFALSPEDLKQGRIESLSTESSGSAQHLLLVEEFYRTGLLIAGRYPAWWLVPPDQEDDYTGFLQHLKKRNLIDEYDVIDFGGAPHIPVSEFLGATLWQLHKAVSSPYKSILKLLLMEAYAHEHPHTELLCTRFKEAVYNGELDIDKLDPYVLMCQKVEEYLVRQRQTERLELARKCFYFKVDIRMSNPIVRTRQRNHSVMTELTNKWGWNRDTLFLLDNRDNWKINQVLEERKQLIEELKYSYKTLTQFARDNSEDNYITSTDLNLLGRRLFSAFERKAGKIELINPGISVDLAEESLYFICVENAGRQSWVLYNADPRADEARKPNPLKRAKTLVELVAWCHFNRLIGTRTVTRVQSNYSSFAASELNETILSFQNHFADTDVINSDIELLGKPAYVVAGAIYLNVGIDPFVAHTRNGYLLTSNRSDALSYGGKWENLLRSCDIVLLSSWGEVLTYHYEGNECILDCLCDFLSWSPVTSDEPPISLSVFCHSSAHGQSMAYRINNLMEEVRDYFYFGSWTQCKRYVLRVGKDYYKIQPEHDVPRFEKVGNETKLLAILSEPQWEFSPIHLDACLERNVSYREIFKINLPFVIQVVFSIVRDVAHVYILDEKGSLFHQRLAFFNRVTLMGQLHQFLTNAVQRRSMMEQEHNDFPMATPIEFYELRLKRLNQGVIVHREAPDEEQAGTYFDIQVISNTDLGGEEDITLYCNGQEYSSLEYGNQVYVVLARQVLRFRQAGQRYPIHITDIDVSRHELQSDSSIPLQTIHFLLYKKRVEEKLNRALVQA